MRLLRPLLAALLLALPLLAFAQERKLEKVTLQLNWFPEAEHGGFYAAQLHGFYKEAGLDVEILGGGPDIPVMQMVATGRVMFGVENADGVLLARAEGAPIVATMAPLQKSPRCIMVHEKSGIKRFEDLKDMTIAMSARAPFYFFLKKNFPLTNVEVVPYNGNVAPFLTNDKWACQGYIFSEPFVAKSKGGDPHSLLVADAGFNPYTSCLLVSEDTLAKNKDLVARMTAASAKGWAKYMADPTETNKLINSKNPEMGMDILTFGVEQLQPLVFDGGVTPETLGTMTPERWETLAKQLVELDLIKPGKVNAREAFLPYPPK